MRPHAPGFLFALLVSLEPRFVKGKGMTLCHFGDFPRLLTPELTRRSRPWPRLLGPFV